MTLVRTQILLTEEQVRRLRRLAQEQGTSMYALVRQALDQALAGLDEEKEDWVARTRRVTRALLEARGGKPIPGDAVELVRSLREERADALAPWADTPRD